MNVIRWILVCFVGLYALDKLIDGMSNQFTSNESEIINLLEIVVSVVLVFVIFKF